MEQRSGLHRDLPAIGVIVAVWVIMAAITGPRGEFPLNDDWSYALSVKWLVQDGVFRITYNTTMTLLTQVLWGALFCLPFGFSFTALRVSSLVAGLAGLIAVYLLARELGAERRIALIGALALAVNPIYFALSNTFMTDVPFFALSTFSIYAFARHLRRGSVAGYVTSIVLACLAVVLRQAALALPLAFAIGYLVKHGVRLPSVIRALVPSAAVGVSLIAYQRWLDVTGRLPEFNGLQMKMTMDFFHHGGEMLIALGDVLLKACVYLGLFLFPLLLAGLVRMRGWKLAVIGALTLAFYLLMPSTGWMGGMPACQGVGHVLIPQGIGPLTSPDFMRANMHNLPPLPHWFWLTVTWISALGASMLVTRLLAGAPTLLRRPGDSETDRPLTAMMASGFVICLAPVVMLYFFCILDRYLLPAIPFAVGAIALLERPPQKLGGGILVAVVIILVLCGVFSVGVTHDYLAWNRARWSALNDVVAKGVSPSEIDGGYEIDGLCTLDSRYGGDWSRRFASKNQVLYAITLGPYPDYEPVKVYQYENWIPPRQGRVFVMRRSW